MGATTPATNTQANAPSHKRHVKSNQTLSDETGEPFLLVLGQTG